MKSRFIIASIFSALCFVSCNNSESKQAVTNSTDTLSSTKMNEMKSYISMFEIPATDISRAINFYQSVLDIKIEKIEVDGMQMGILPYEGQIATGVIIQAADYKPSENGVVVYLNAGDNLQNALDKVVLNGGKIMTPKTAHADGNGYFAVFLDSEGNKMALNSPN
jgi:predicted enzyme related to lactoylglutathione lyase